MPGAKFFFLPPFLKYHLPHYTIPKTTIFLLKFAKFIFAAIVYMPRQVDFLWVNADNIHND